MPLRSLTGTLVKHDGWLAKANVLRARYAAERAFVELLIRCERPVKAVVSLVKRVAK